MRRRSVARRSRRRRKNRGRPARPGRIRGTGGRRITIPGDAETPVPGRREPSPEPRSETFRVGGFGAVVRPRQRAGQYRDTPSPVPRGSRRPGSRRLHAGHRLASQRTPARLIPESPKHPGSDVIEVGFDTSATIRLHSPSRSPPDASHDAFSSSLTTTVFSQRSMRRLEASLRRATPKGHETFISRTAPHQGLSPTSALLAFRTHFGTHRSITIPGASLPGLRS